MRFPIELWNSDAERVAVLARVAEAPAGPVLVVDKLGNTVFLNDAAERLLGERADALVNWLATALLGLAQDRQGRGEAFTRSIERGESWSGSVRPAVAPKGKRPRARKATLEMIVRENKGQKSILGGIIQLL